jgi:hypothetical protein
MNSYTSGTLVRMTFTVTQLNGQPIDPTAVSCKVKTPDGVVTDLSGSVVRDSQGLYHADILTAQYGVHDYEWIGTGLAPITGRAQFDVTLTTF